jgi:hypothetical protein
MVSFHFSSVRLTSLSPGNEKSRKPEAAGTLD